MDTENLNHDDLESFHEAYNDLLNAFHKCLKTESGCERAVKFYLPIECDYLNKTCARLSILSAATASSNHQGNISTLFYDTLMNVLIGRTTNQSSFLDYHHQNESKKTIQKHFNIVKKPKSLSIIDELRVKAAHYSKSKLVKSSLMSTSGSSIGSGSGGIAGQGEMIVDSTRAEAISANNTSSASSKSFSFVNRLTSSKKMESITALNNSSALNSSLNDSLTSSPYSKSSSSAASRSSLSGAGVGGSSSFFKNSMISGSCTTITGKSSIKRDVGIKVLHFFQDFFVVVSFYSTRTEN